MIIPEPTPDFYNNRRCRKTTLLIAKAFSHVLLVNCGIFKKPEAHVFIPLYMDNEIKISPYALPKPKNHVEKIMEADYALATGADRKTMTANWNSRGFCLFLFSNLDNYPY